MNEIRTREEFVALAKHLGVRRDWHEPDEQDVTAECVGDGAFDNAGFDDELHIVIKKGGLQEYRVNLATLLAWASGYDETCADMPPTMFCEHCCGEIAKPVWLELSATDGEYYYKLPDGHESQGGFPFGSTCAPKVAADGPSK